MVGLINRKNTMPADTTDNTPGIRNNADSSVSSSAHDVKNTHPPLKKTRHTGIFSSIRAFTSSCISSLATVCRARFIEDPPLRRFINVLITVGCAGIIAASIVFAGQLIGSDTTDSDWTIWPENEIPKSDYLSAVTNHFRGNNNQVFIHTVVKGENYWLIAKSNGVDIETMLGANPQWHNTTAGIDEKIVVLLTKGTLHYVRKGQSIKKIAHMYGAATKLVRINNHLLWPLQPHIGDVLILPGCHHLVHTPEMHAALAIRGQFINPSTGYLGSKFGMRMHPILGYVRLHKGIDLHSPSGHPCWSAADGVVAYTGNGGSYGKVIYINHDNGFQTRYAHLSRILTRTGRTVKQGQVIGRTGNSGLSTTPHLHFEIRSNGIPVDPMNYLW